MINKRELYGLASILIFGLVLFSAKYVQKNTHFKEWELVPTSSTWSTYLSSTCTISLKYPPKWSPQDTHVCAYLVNGKVFFKIERISIGTVMNEQLLTSSKDYIKAFNLVPNKDKPSITNAYTTVDGSVEGSVNANANFIYNLSWPTNLETKEQGIIYEILGTLEYNPKTTP